MHHLLAPNLCRIVAAACLGDRDCLVRASSDAFTDACPGTPKTLRFGYT